MFWIHSWDVCKIVQYFFLKILCQSVCLLDFIRNEIKQAQLHLPIWLKYLSANFGTHSWDVCKLNPNKYISYFAYGVSFWDLWSCVVNTKDLPKKLISNCTVLEILMISIGDEVKLFVPTSWGTFQENKSVFMNKIKIDSY